MFVNFGEGKCPLCGDFGRRARGKSYSCGKCSLAFDNFSVMFAEEPEEQNRFWN